MVSALTPKTNVFVGTGKPDNGAIAVYVYGAVDAAALEPHAGVISVEPAGGKCIKVRMEQRWFSYHVGLLRDAVGGNLPAPNAAEVAAFAKTPVKASSKPVARFQGIPLPIPTPESVAVALDAKESHSSNDLAPSWTGWYAWRWWVAGNLRIFHSKDIPAFGGNEGGANDLFGPFDTEAAAAHCALVMGIAERVTGVLDFALRALPPPDRTLPAPVAIVALLPAPAFERCWHVNGALWDIYTWQAFGASKEDTKRIQQLLHDNPGGYVFHHRQLNGARSLAIPKRTRARIPDGAFGTDEYVAECLREVA